MKFGWFSRSTRREVCSWWGVAWSSILAGCVVAIPNVASLAFLGRVSVTAMAAVSVTWMIAFGFCSVLWSGLTITQAALVSQAFGSRNYNAVYGWTLLRLLFDGVLTVFFILPVWFSTPAIIGAFGFEDLSNALVSEYLLYATPVIFTVAPMNAMSTHMTSLQRTWQPALLEIAYCAASVAANYAFIFGVSVGGVQRIEPMGVKGAGLGDTAACCVCLVCTIAMMLALHRPLDMPDEEEEEEEAEGEEEEVGAGELNAAAATAAAAAAAANGKLDSPLLPQRSPKLQHPASPKLRPAMNTLALAGTHAISYGAIAHTSHSLNRSSSIHPHPSSSPSVGSNFLRPSSSSSSSGSGAGYNAIGSAEAINVDVAAGTAELDSLLLPPPAAVSEDSKRSAGRALPSSSGARSHADALAAVSLRKIVRFACAWKNVRVFGCQFLANGSSMALEIGKAQVLTLMAANFGVVAVATNAALGETFELASQVLYGLGEATAIRIGFHLGNDAPGAARRSMRTTLVFSVAWALVFAAVVFALPSKLGLLFSDDPAVLDQAAIVAPYLAGTYMSYAVYMHFACVLDGSGSAGTNAGVSLVGSFGLTVIVAALTLKFSQLQLKGLWMGNIIGTSIAAAVAAFFVCRSDWKALAKLALERAEADAEQDALTEEDGLGLLSSKVPLATSQDGDNAPTTMTQQNDSEGGAGAV